MVLLILELDLTPRQAEDDLSAVATQRFKATLKLDRILKKSIDARKKDRVFVRVRAVFSAKESDRPNLVKQGAQAWVPEVVETSLPARTQPSVVVVGSGPAGLFCALRLSERGVPCTILEQGKAVEDRHQDIERLRETGVLDPFSNVVFGEGGAGTYSDGKLTTRIHKPGISWVFDRLVEHGAPASIVYDAKPHVGTDVLSRVVTSIRRALQSRGSQVLFGQRVVGFETRDGAVRAVKTDEGALFPAQAVVLACGHSARPLFEALHREGIPLERKGFAVGVRIEHPAEFINRAQYGRFADQLPAADYRLTWNNPATGRGTYSFCMCPGGEVVNSSSEPGMLCVNGMSYRARDLPHSNAALVTTVTEEDGPSGVLGGIEFQRTLERLAFEAGGGGQRAPQNSAREFLRSGSARGVQASSYRPGSSPAAFDQFLPSFVTAELRLALADFDRRLPGYVDQGVLVGVETRTSSPVRILRGFDFQSPSLRGLYPAGEGAGYAGGIVSSAVDGVRLADAICDASFS